MERKSKAIQDPCARLEIVYTRPPNLVHCFTYIGSTVVIKMGGRQDGPSRTGVRGRISESIRNRRATRPSAHFHPNPLGRGRWLFFGVARSSRINLDMLVVRALKNSQLTCGGAFDICETVH
jgi:hypothetical protein